MDPHPPFFFDSWYLIGRTATLSVLGFISLFTMLRISGKRTLSELTVFDFVFVVSLGSVFAATIIEKDVTLIEGMTAQAILISIQVVLAKLAVYSRTAERIINGEPTRLLTNGKYLHKAMRRERITEEEIRAAIRSEGVTRVEDVDAVMLENDGSLTVAWESKTPGKSALVDAENLGEEKGSGPKN
ncbi:MAG TPA: YetF domain-containing protein [Gemmatimonadaceae bacterium]|nr:YetF domain-containing protein [Gemmatimonadaceae bacterium]